MAYTTNQALETLNRYLGITDDEKQIIENTKRRGFVFSLPNGEKAAVLFIPWFISKIIQRIILIQEIVVPMKEE